MFWQKSNWICKMIECQTDAKCEYMKQYMKKSRMDKTFRNIERQNELTTKRSARQNLLFKQNEALSKRTQRQDEIFQQYEASRE